MSEDKMGLNAAWSMAVGGMIGGGIFSVLGVVTEIAGSLFWISLLTAGVIALCSGWSYVKLADKLDEGGGAFTYLRDMGMGNLAATLAWLLIAGYTFTVSVYAFTFGHYLAEAVGLGPFMTRATEIAIVAVLVGVNLVGVSEASKAEIFAVWGKVAILAALGIWGLASWGPSGLDAGRSPDGGALAPFFAAAAIFMAYEGFQLLTYDYDEIRDPDRTLTTGVLTAVASVVIIYLVVSFGAAMLVGLDALIEHKEVALAKAGQAAAGTIGKWVVTFGAVLSTGSAINATLFATARLSQKVAADTALSRWFTHENSRGMPDRALLVIGVVGAALAVVGGLTQLVETASLLFLITFTAVNGAALRGRTPGAWVSGIGAVGAAVATVLLIVRMAATNLTALLLLAGLVVVVTLIQSFTSRDGDGP